LQEEGWALHPGLAATLENQELVYMLSQSFCCTHEPPRRHCQFEDDEPEIEFPAEFARFFIGFEAIQDDEVLVFAAARNKNKSVKSKHSMVEKNYDALSPADVEKHWPAVQAGMRKELAAFHELKTFERMQRALSKNHCTARWVLRWKEVSGERVVKARLTIRGFQDLATEITTYAATASRWAQRICCSIAATEGWQIWTLDVGNAFLRGMNFTDYAEITGEPIRQISFSPPTNSEPLIRELKGFETFNSTTECLNLLKPAYGLRDAPRAWKVRLDKALQVIGAKPLPTDASVYTMHKGEVLELFITCHVDDLKVTGNVKARAALLAGLISQFGKIVEKAETFEHCGLLHSRGPDNCIKMSQEHYVKQLKLQDVSAMAVDKTETPLTTTQLACFQSLLGAVAWLCQTRPDIPIYTQALQRAVHHATVGHALKLNKLVRWCRRKPCYLVYYKLKMPCKVIAISDAAFRREDPSALAMRGAIVGLCERHDQAATPGGRIHILEFYSRRQRRVTRSTFAAETQALVDSYEVARVITMTLAAIQLPGRSTQQLMHLEEQGKLPLWVEGVVDCRSIFDTLATPEPKAPSEGSLIMVLAGLKEALRTHHLKRLWWVDTKDMLSDGLNKGLVPRTDLLLASCTGLWQLKHACKCFQEVTHVPIESSQSFAKSVFVLFQCTVLQSMNKFGYCYG
jgi:hypothetical protein